MATSLDDAKRDEWERTHGYMQEVACTTCGSHWSCRFIEGEPVHDDSLNCHCGGVGEEL